MMTLRVSLFLIFFFYFLVWFGFYCFVLFFRESTQKGPAKPRSELIAPCRSCSSITQFVVILSFLLFVTLLVPLGRGTGHIAAHSHLLYHMNVRSLPLDMSPNQWDAVENRVFLCLFLLDFLRLPERD